MGTPAIFNGKRTKLLTAKGLVTSAGQCIDNDGERNYIRNNSGFGSTQGWTVVGDLNLLPTSTAAELPRENTTGSGIKITATDGSQSTADYVYYDFTLDDVDLNRQLKIKFDVKKLANYAGTLEVMVATQALRTTAITGSTATAIQAADGTFYAEFTSDSTATLSLIIRANAEMTTDDGICISDVVVGPGLLVSGPAATGWTSYTPTGSWVTNATYVGSWRRIGDSMEIVAAVKTTGAPTSAVLTISVPSGYTIDTAKFPALTFQAAGVADIYDSGTSVRTGVALVSTSTTFVIYSADSVGDNVVSQAQPITFANGDEVCIHVVVPIVGWSTNAYYGSEQVEYASNSKSDNTATDTTSFAYGPQGSLVPNGATGTAYARTVQFSRPIQPSDKLSVEFDLRTSGARWIDSSQLTPLLLQKTNTYGINVSSSTSTTCVVSFGIGGYSASGTNYGDNGSAWSGLSTWRWRVKKVSTPGLAGFNVATTSQPTGLLQAGAIPGIGTSTVASTGYVGEIITSSVARSAGVSLTSTVTANIAGIVITPGHWDVQASIGFRPTHANTAYRAVNIGISKTSATMPGADTYSVPTSGEVSTSITSATNVLGSGYDINQTTPMTPVYVAAGNTLTLYCVVNAEFTGASATATGYGSITARRVR